MSQDDARVRCVELNYEHHRTCMLVVRLSLAALHRIKVSALREAMMAGLLYCRYCDYSSSARLMGQHERACSSNPEAIAPATQPTELGHVASDHFRYQFIRAGDETKQLDALAAHCAYLYNQLQDERRLRLASYHDIVQRLEAASPLTALALSLAEAAREMEE